MAIERTPADLVPFTYIDTDAGVADVVEAVRPLDRVAFDTEANGLYRYHQRVCLMQLSTDNETYIIDPLSDADVSPLLDVLRERELIFHAADFDLRMLRSTFDFTPQGRIFDTMIGAQLLGVQELGLVTVANKFLGIELTKHGQKSDWTRRPLTQKQLAYASDDTRYLIRLAEKIEAELGRLGRTHWHEETCARMVASTAEDACRNEPWRIRGSGLLKSEELLFLKFLWEWRESEAAAADVPPFKVLGNAALLDIAKWAAAHRDKRLQNVPHVPKSMRPPRRRSLMSALRQARMTPKRDWPAPPARGERPAPTPGFKKRVAYLQRECERLAADLDMPASVIAPRNAIIEIVREDCATLEELRENTGLMDWQAELMANAIGDGYLKLVDAGDD